MNIEEREDGCGINIFHGDEMVSSMERHEVRDLHFCLGGIINKWDGDNKPNKFNCSHSRTFEFYPENCYFNRDGEAKGKMHHGAKVTGCMTCGKVWAEDYAE